MKIGFVSLHHLRDWGGVTRLIDRTAGAMARRGHSVCLIALEGKGSKKTPVETRKYPHELVTINLNDTYGWDEARKKIAAAEIDICASPHVMHMPGLLCGSKIPLLLSAMHDPRVHSEGSFNPYEVYGAMHCADAIQVLLPGFLPLYPDALKQKITVVGNPGPPPAEVDFEARRNKKIRTIVAVGRFDEELKRFSLLLRAFAALHKDFPEWRLKMVGDGPYWAYYRIMAEQLGIKKFVKFTGAVADPSGHYRDADIFCLSSLKGEGFGLVNVEAASFALPLVGFSSSVPTMEMIGDGMGAVADASFNVNLIESLAGALRSLMQETPQRREEMGKKCQRVLFEKFNEELIFDQWEELADRTCRKDKTALEVNIKMAGHYSGLQPDSPVWTEEILAGASAEIARRENPLSPVEDVRLKSELAKQRADYEILEKKYNALLAQMQGGNLPRQLAGFPGKAKKPTAQKF